MLDIVTWYFDSTSQYPRLDKEKEVELFKRYEQGGEIGKEAKKQIIESNLKLVIGNARSFAGHGLDIEDLIQEGNLGLIRAVEKFDYRKGYKFSTIATHYIRQSMSRALSNQGRTIRLPVHIVDKMCELRRRRVELNSALGREPSHSELAEALGITEKKVYSLLEVSQIPSSLEFAINGEGEGNKDRKLNEVIADENDMTGLQNSIKESLKEELGFALDKLSDKQRRVIVLRFGLEGEPMTYKEIAKEFRTTYQWVCQLEKQALDRLSKIAKRRGLKVFLED